jgi:hypothetical protein
MTTFDPDDTWRMSEEPAAQYCTEAPGQTVQVIVVIRRFVKKKN